MAKTLPVFARETLRDTSTPELIRLLIRNEDRVPRNVTDECARRGDEMLDELAKLLEKDYYWTEDRALGELWLLVHAVMILGLMPHDRAGALLVAYMRRMEGEQNEDVRGWFADEWAALFRNKPPSTLRLLRELAEDRSVDLDLRVEAVQAVLGQSAQGDALEDALAWAAAITFSDTEAPNMSAYAGDMLLDFPRAQFRAQLEDLARAQDDADLQLFDTHDVEEAYRAQRDRADEPVSEDPWRFYFTEEICDRQRRWASQEARRHIRYIAEDPWDPYVRETPKIGRNDPCPCGSGKKYKKCCLNAAT